MVVAEQAACAAGDNGGEVDHLSGLPDDILLDILERIVTSGDAHAAARTSVLSRRWRHLPWQNVTNVSLDVSDFIPDPDDTHPLDRWFRPYHERATSSLAAALATFLAAPASERVVEHLRLTLVLTTDEHVRGVVALVGGALDDGRVRGGAVELEILADQRGCWCMSNADDEEDLLGYGRRFSRLRRSCPGAFLSLARLSVECLWFDGGGGGGGGEISDLLKDCPSIEYLYMRFCGFVPFAVMAIDAPPESRLATLVLDQCAVAGVELVNAPKLKELYYYWLNNKPVVSCGVTPSLTDITLENCCQSRDGDGLDYNFNRKLSDLILQNPGQLENLCLRFSDTQIWVQPEEPKQLTSQLAGLKKLELDDISHTCNFLSWTTFLLEAAPLLETFTIATDNHVCDRDEWRTKRRSPPAQQPSPGFKHHHLAELSIRRAIGIAVDLPFARMVMEVAVNLKNLTMGVESLECEDCDAAVLKSPDLARSMIRFPGSQQYVDSFVDKLRHGISTSARIEILGII